MMNLKFILFCVASIGSLIIIYMWFSMNSNVRSSQTTEEQYAYKINSLKSEIDFEKRLMESLRRDAKNYGQTYKEKSTVFEKMNRNEEINNLEKEKLDKSYTQLNDDYEKLKKSNDERVSKLKGESDSKLKEDNENIERLESEVKKLETEQQFLQGKVKKSVSSNNNNTASASDRKSGKPIENMMQAKAPKFNVKTKEDLPSEKKSESQMNPDLDAQDLSNRLKPKPNVPKEESLKKETEENKENRKIGMNKLKPEVNDELDPKKDNGFKLSKETMLKKEDENSQFDQLQQKRQQSQLNIKNDNKNDEVLRPPVNPKIIPKIGNFPSNDLQNNSSPVKPEINRDKKLKYNEPDVHQLMPPMKDKPQRIGNKGQIDNLRQKKDIEGY